MKFEHKSVLLNESIEGLKINPDGIYVDGTLGGAGHSIEILKRLSNNGRLIGIDRDTDAIQAAKEKLKDVILKPGEYADVEIILTWVNSPDNVKAMNNVAEISKDYNESGTPDIDSTPDNKKPDEDDYDDAPVIVTMVTGSAPKYLALTTGFLTIIVAGAVLLKKYVLS